MYKKKEFLCIIALILLIFIFPFFTNSKESKENEIIEFSNKIEVTVKGEIAKDIKLTYYKPLTYGKLFLQINNLLNEYSDLSNYNLKELINESIEITIPTKKESTTYKININTASYEELMSLPYIKESRATKILEYINKNGKFKSWDEFFSIVGVSDEVKKQIIEQAVLQ